MKNAIWERSFMAEKLGNNYKEKRMTNSVEETMKHVCNKSLFQIGYFRIAQTRRRVFDY